MTSHEHFVQQWAKQHQIELGFLNSQVKAAYIWNPGGFVNQSYMITDGIKKLHVKMADGDHEPYLRQWALVHDYLTTHYHAPKMVMEVKEAVIPGYPYGLVFEFFEGRPFEKEFLSVDILQKIAELHRDEALKKLSKGKNVSYADAFINTYISRFKEDIAIINANQNLLPFVEEEAFKWFYIVVDCLEKEVRESASFQRVASDVVHKDLNPQNILINDGGFCIIDWDDLSGNGDAAMDYATLLWPIYQTAQWPFWRDKVGELADHQTLERMSYNFQASLLDEVIDVLADYVEAEDMPEVKEKTQKRAKEIHLHAFEKYRSLYRC